MQPPHPRHHNSFRPIADVYCNSLTTRADIRSPQWSMPANYLDGDDDDLDGAWTQDADMVRHRAPPAYSHSPPQLVYRRPTPISAVSPILRPDNYTLKRPRPIPAASATDAGIGEVGESETTGHLLGYLGDAAVGVGGDTTDSGYSLQRSTAPPSPAPLDSV